MLSRACIRAYKLRKQREGSGHGWDGSERLATTSAGMGGLPPHFNQVSGSCAQLLWNGRRAISPRGLRKMTKNEIVNYCHAGLPLFPEAGLGKVVGRPTTNGRPAHHKCGGPAYHGPNRKYDHSPSYVPSVTSIVRSESLVAVRGRHPWPPILFLHTLQEQITHNSDYGPNLRGRFLISNGIRRKRLGY